MEAIANILSKSNNGQAENSHQPKTPLSLVKPTPVSDVCPQCGDMGYFRQDVPVGHTNFGKLVKCLSEFHNETRLQRLSKVSGLNQHELQRRLTDIKRVYQDGASNVTMLDAARSMIDNRYGWLFIHGGPGNAKSEVLISIVNELNERNQGPAIYNKFVIVIA